MAPRASGTSTLKKKNLPKIEANIYSIIPLQELVVFAIHYLQGQAVAVTVEEVVSICFRLFPQSFSLKNYPRWPDSALVIRRLNDAREKGFVKGNPHDGFALKYLGQKLAERTAKALGLIRSAPVVKKTTPSKLIKNIKAVEKIAKVEPKVVTARKKTNKATLKKTLTKPQPQVAAVKKAVKETLVVSKKAPKKTVVQTTLVKKSQPVEMPKHKIKPKVVDSKQVVKKKRLQAPVAQKQPVKSVPVKAQKKESSKTLPVQMEMILPAKEIKPVAQPVKKKKASPAPALTKLQTIQPEVIIPAKATAVSKEEKVKAEKIVRAMEKSDAYKLFNNNGSRAKISEFDFRNLLFATMESTPETLARNVNLFKGSAAIHNRQDLIKFLDYCETNFAGLLKPTAKKIVKKK